MDLKSRKNYLTLAHQTANLINKSYTCITMAQITTKVKKWGNSLGVLLPKELVQDEKLKEGSEISIFIQQKK